MKRLSVVAALFALLSCTSTPKRLENPVQSLGPAKTKISVMTFNVENLFDTKHDQGKDDYTFLPLSQKQTKEHKAVCDKIEVSRWRKDCLEEDWNETLLVEKLKRLAGTILQVNEGKGPDVLIVQEVENVGVLDRLRKEYLQAANYRPAILIEGPDERGIDIGVLTRLPEIGQAQLHKLNVGRDTRGILQVDLKLPEKGELTVLGAHFPNPQHPAEFRETAVKELNAIRAKLPGDRFVIAAGDMNTTSQEAEKSRRWERLQEQKENPWVVSHLAGCAKCEGTQYFWPGRSWSFLDVMLFSKNLTTPGSAWLVNTDSIDALKGFAPQVDSQGRPARFSGAKGSQGVSDHLPVLAVIELR